MKARAGEEGTADLRLHLAGSEGEPDDVVAFDSDRGTFTTLAHLRFTDGTTRMVEAGSVDADWGEAHYFGSYAVVDDSGVVVAETPQWVKDATDGFSSPFVTLTPELEEYINQQIADGAPVGATESASTPTAV